MRTDVIIFSLCDFSFFYYYFDILGNEHQVLLPDYPLAAF